jgi:diaminohydroxyphosphoribosylaminopyrimidine deaminase/5-amino-6-(5-phosphoribosylamino)uracil reductase
VLIDDPSLTVRLGDDTPFVPPMRVVLDPGLATIARGMVRDAAAPTLYLHAPDAKPARDINVQRAAVPVTAGRFDLHTVLTLLAAREINEVQVEAGATLAGAFLAEGLADEVLLYVAPVLLGERARPLFAGLGIDAMAQRAQLKVVDARAMGEDQRILLQPTHMP